jgi:hypothetical protein
MVAICQWPHNRCASCQSHKEWTTDSWEYAQKTKWWVFAQQLYDHWYIAAITALYANRRCPICHSRGSRRRVIAKSAGSREPVFYIDGCATLQTFTLRWPIFKQKKGSLTISLGLNYCSMGSSQPTISWHFPFHVLKVEKLISRIVNPHKKLKCYFLKTLASKNRKKFNNLINSLFVPWVYALKISFCQRWLLLMSKDASFFTHYYSHNVYSENNFKFRS